MGRKIVLGLLLCSGMFVFIAALLRCIESLGAIGNIYNSTIWGIREVFVGICAVCAPGIKPLFSKRKGTPTVLSGDGAVELKRTHSRSNQARSDRSGSERENSFEKLGITLTHETVSRDTLGLIGRRPEPAFHPSNTQSFTSTRPRTWSEYDQEELYPPRASFLRKMPLSVIYSESTSRMSTCSIGTSVINKSAFHTPPEMPVVDTAEPLQVHIRNDSGLQQEVEAGLAHIYHKGADIDLEKGLEPVNPQQHGINEPVQGIHKEEAKGKAGARVLI